LQIYTKHAKIQLLFLRIILTVHRKYGKH